MHTWFMYNILLKANTFSVGNLEQTSWLELVYVNVKYVFISEFRYESPSRRSLKF